MRRLFARWRAYLSLKRRYGLKAAEPTQDQAKDWADRTQRLIELGWDSDVAGEDSAQNVFKTYRSRLVESQADTVHDILKNLAD